MKLMAEATHLSNLLHLAILSEPVISVTKLHAQFLKRGIELNLFLSNRLVFLYSRSASTLRDAHKVFDELPNPNVVTWTTLITGYTRANLPLRALRLFVSMLQHPTFPNQHTFSAIFRACATISADKSGLQIHAHAVKLGFDRYVFVGSSLVDMHSKCGWVDHALQVFVEMPDRDEVSWGGIICCCSQNRRPLEAMRLFSVMHHLRVPTNMFSLSGALRASSEAVAYDHGRMLHGHGFTVGLEANVYVGSALVDTYAKCGMVADARQAFDWIAEPNLVSWNAIIMAYAQQGNENAARKLFNELLRNGVILPDGITFLSILTACSNSGMVDDALRYLRSMVAKFELSPSVEHYTCVISVLGRVGLVSEAEDLALRMPLTPDRAVWRVILSACILHGEFEMGRRVGVRALQSVDDDGEDGDNASLYVLLSNIFSGKARWSEAARLRREMDDLRASKESGWSWIEINRQLHLFMSGDKAHPCTEEIYGLLAAMVEEIREAVMVGGAVTHNITAQM